jgi:hypothetical protein
MGGSEPPPQAPVQPTRVKAASATIRLAAIRLGFMCMDLSIVPGGGVGDAARPGGSMRPSSCLALSGPGGLVLLADADAVPG